MFEFMPLGAIIGDKATQNKIFCVHAGIGTSITKLEEIERIPRPLKVNLGGINDSVQ